MNQVEVPDEFRSFECEEYFSSEVFKNGIFDAQGQLYIVAPVRDLRIDQKHSFLAVGHPGADGIEFVYRAGHRGIWAFYPYESSFLHIAPSLTALVSGWSAGTIVV